MKNFTFHYFIFATQIQNSGKIIAFLLFELNITNNINQKQWQKQMTMAAAASAVVVVPAAAGAAAMVL